MNRSDPIATLSVKPPIRHRRQRTLLAVLAAITLPVLLVACGSDGSDSGSSGPKIAVTITDNGCSPSNLKAESGPVTFAIENVDSEVNNEFEILNGDKVVGEEEKLVPGLSAELQVTLDPGTYDIVCGRPGDPGPAGRLVVSGS